MPGIWTQGRSMIGADKATDLWRPPNLWHPLSLLCPKVRLFLCSFYHPFFLSWTVVHLNYNPPVSNKNLTGVGESSVQWLWEGTYIKRFLSFNPTPVTCRWIMFLHIQKFVLLFTKNNLKICRQWPIFQMPHTWFRWRANFNYWDIQFLDNIS